MRLKVIISGSRFSRERDILKDEFRKTIYSDIQLYDCEEYTTDMTKEGKQAEINSLLENYDWYILIAPTKYYGEFTWIEWDTILDSIKKKQREQMITVFKCNNPIVSIKAQGIQETGTYEFDDFKSLCTEKGIGYNFSKTYEYDGPEFCSLRMAVLNEIRIALTKNLVMRNHSIPLNQITAKDVFANLYRTNQENGFNEELYLFRTSLDEVLNRSTGFTLVIGPPASGKTRSIYEYLKRRSTKSPQDRLIIVNRSTLLHIVQYLRAYKDWHETLIDRDKQDLSNYYFICDQISDTVYNSENVNLFVELHDLAVQAFSARLVATSLAESYDQIKQEKEWILEPDEIKIVRLSEEMDSDFLRTLKEQFNVENNTMGYRQVIGDYIQGLVDYNESVKRLAEKYSYKHQGIVEAFVKAYCVIHMFRRGNIMPLGLVITVLEKIILKNMTNERLAHLLKFFSQNNILEVFSDDEFISQPTIQRDRLYTYDKEQMKMLIDPSFLIEIGNDYIWWEVLYKEYAFDFGKSEDMGKCLNYYSEAFLEDNPISTLRRIIVRSPAVTLSLIYDAQPNFVRIFTINKLRALCDNESLWQTENFEMRSLIAHVLHRSKDLESFRTDFNLFRQWSKEHFYLDEDIVAELMGFGSRHNKAIKQRLIQFLEENGWDFTTHFGISYYYHKRIIEYKNDFTEIEAYMDHNVLLPEVMDCQYSDEGLTQNNKLQIIRSILRRCGNVKDLSKLLDWARTLNVRFDRYLMFDLCDVVCKSNSMQETNENAEVITSLHTFFEEGMIDIKPGLVYYYLIDMTCCFKNALDYFTKGERILDKVLPLKYRALSTMLKRSRPDDFCLIFRYLFEDNKLKIVLPQVSRNQLLKRLLFYDALSMVQLLFDGSDYDSTPDVNTLISILTTNVDFRKKSYSKEISYQNLSMILTHPNLQNINYNESAINLILQSCMSEAQETDVINKFIKKNYIDMLRKKHGGTPIDLSLEKNTLKYWEELRLSYKVATTRIRQMWRMDFKWVLRYAFEVMDNMFATGKVVDSSLLNVTLGKLFAFYTDSNLIKQTITREEMDKFRAEIKNYLNLPMPSKGRNIHPKRIDYIIKDEFYYPAYYRLYPEDLIFRNGDGHYALDLNSIMIKYINVKFFSNVLQGVAALMGKEVLRDIEFWLIDNTNDFHWDKYAYRLVKKLYQDYQFNTDRTPSLDESTGALIIKSRKDIQDSCWDFLSSYYERWEEEDRYIHKTSMPQTKQKSRKAYTLCKVKFEKKLLDKIQEVKALYPDSYPDMNLMRKLLRSKSIQALYMIDILEYIFLQHDLAIPPTLWKVALDSIRYRIRYYSEEAGVEFSLLRIKKQYPHLIFNDNTTLTLQLFILSGKEQEDCFKEVMASNCFKSLMDYSELIMLVELFNANFDDYVNIMSKYEELKKTIYGTHYITQTYSHFLLNCAKKYREVKELLDHSQKRAIIKLITAILLSPDKSWLESHLTEEKERYIEMLDDLEASSCTTRDVQKITQLRYLL